MMHEEEMIRRMHERAAEKLSRKERRTAVAAGCGGFAMTALLVAMIARYTKGDHSVSRMSFAGASLLGDDAGGYVLIALIAFIAGVAVTVACLRYRKLREAKNGPRAGCAE